MVMKSFVLYTYIGVVSILAPSPCSCFVPNSLPSEVYKGFHRENEINKDTTNHRYAYLTKSRSIGIRKDRCRSKNEKCTLLHQSQFASVEPSSSTSTTNGVSDRNINTVNGQSAVISEVSQSSTSTAQAKNEIQELEQQPSLPAQPEQPPPHAAQTLDGRLLCAAQCAYEISAPYFRASSYRPGTTAKRVTRGVNSALIGHTTDGITIAFRGTQTTSLLDWLQNAALFLSDVDEKKYKIKGKIHTGFYRGTMSLWKPVRKIVKEMLEISEENGWSQNVYLTGHSKGGAMASIAAVLLKRESSLPDPTYVCTFASARVGDSQFRNAYNQHINQTSYEAHLDLIPFLPPSSTTMDTMSDGMSEMIEEVLWSQSSFSMKESYKWDYQTLGQRKYISEDGEIIDEVTKELDAMRIAEIESKTILSLDEFKEAHCSGCASEGCGGIYFSAIAGDICDVMCVEDE